MNDAWQERRKYARYETEAKIYFRVTYDIKTKVKFQVIDKEKDKILPPRYSAMSQNVSVEGLCFTSTKNLAQGNILYIEVYLPGRKDPVCTEGEVRWSRATSPDQKMKDKFNTGVKLLRINGCPVAESIYHDQVNRVAWSAVLESIFGSFKMFAASRHASRKSSKKR